MNTPRRLKLYLAGIWVLASVLLLIGEGTLAGARDANKTIGRDAAPSILAAAEISANLADFDTNEANAMLGTAKQAAAALDVLEKRRVKLTERMVFAASNVTYGDEERVPIRELFEGFGLYLERVTSARARFAAGDAPGALAEYRGATDLMHQKLLPAAEQLDAANLRYLDLAYQNAAKRSAIADVVAVLLGIALVALLLHAQLFTLRRMRRRINPALFTATMLTAWFTYYLFASMGTARENLRAAKEDAFDSIHMLWQARAIAYDGNGDETRYLYDRERAQYWEGEFNRKTARLSSSPGNARPPKAGIFAKELANITYEGEREAATEMVGTFAKYYEIDHRIRALETGGRHADAIELCIGTRPDESNAAFDRFDSALGKTLEINVKQFDVIVRKADESLGVASWTNPFVSLLVALLGYLGIRARLGEYRA